VQRSKKVQRWCRKEKQRSAELQVKVQRFITGDYAGDFAGGAKVLQRFTRGGSEAVQRCGAGAKVQIWRCNEEKYGVC